MLLRVSGVRRVLLAKGRCKNRDGGKSPALSACAVRRVNHFCLRVASAKNVTPAINVVVTGVEREEGLHRCIHNKSSTGRIRGGFSLELSALAQSAEVFNKAASC
jgi:hypothetical protein